MASIIETLAAAGGSADPGKLKSVPETCMKQNTNPDIRLEGFLNALLAQLWPNMCVAGAAIVKNVAEPMFAKMLPSPLNTLHFKKIDLGLVPIKFANADVHRTEGEGIKLNLDVDWDGRCDIELDATGIPKIGVEHVKLRGRMSILLCPLTNVIPLIGAAQVSFINPPYLHLDFTDAGGIGDIDLIDRCIKKVALQIISGMAVLPNRFLVKLDPQNDYFKTYQHPLGLLRLTVESGANFGDEKPKTRNIFKKLLRDVPDCFVKVNVSAEDQWRTSVAKNNHHPEWNETHDFLVTDLDQEIQADVQDKDTAFDDDMGVARTTVKALLSAGGRQELELLHEEEATDGRLTVGGKFYQFVADPSSFGEENVEGDGVVGLLTVLIDSAFGVIGRRQDLKPSVKVTWGAH